MSSVTHQHLFSSPRVEVKGRLLWSLVTVTVLVCVGVIAIALMTAYRRVQTATRSVVETSLSRAEQGVRRYLEPVEKQLNLVRDQGLRGLLADDGGEHLDALLMPVLRRMPQVSSLMVSHPGGREYMLLQREAGFLGRRVSADDAPGTANLRELSLDGRAVKTTEDELQYDPRTRPWHAGALASPGTIHWTKPYLFFTTKEPGITVSLAFQAPGEAALSVVAFDVLLSDLSNFTMNFDVGANGKLIVVDEDRLTVGLPRSDRFADAAVRAEAALQPCDAIGVPEAEDAVEHFRNLDAEEGALFSFETGGETWWAGGRQLVLGGGRTLGVAVLTPESDFLGDVQRERNLLIGLSLIAVVLAAGIALLLSKRLKQDLDTAVDAARNLGQYTLERKIGSGAMGAVYRAQHSMLRRPTAVKLMAPEETAKPGALERFAHEVQMTAQLNHPNTIAVYDFGQTAQGVFYYAMEYLDGVTLQGLVDACGPQPAARVIHILYQVCGSLYEAHSAGMVHRDVKPANVMLCRSGGMFDVAKVLDFGLVRHQETTLEHSIAENPKGTPLYMSPEAFMTPTDVDLRADLYAVGAVGYFLLTGRPPFNEKSLTLLFTQIIQQEVVAPSDLVQEGVPADLEMMILACLRKQADDRPQSALQLAGMLEHCRDFRRWTRTDAHDWWSQNAALLPIDANDSTETPGAPAGPVTRHLQRASDPDANPTVDGV